MAVSIYNVVKWSLRVNWVQYEPNLKIPIWEYTPMWILQVWSYFGPMGQISQISSFTSYLGQRNVSKLVQFGNVKYITLQYSQKTKLSPKAPMRPLNGKKKALIILVQSNHDHWWKKSILERVIFFVLLSSDLTA